MRFSMEGEFMTKSTTANPPKPAPAAEHKRLGIFVGTWNLEGRQHAGPVGKAAEITGVERYEWLAGGLFLVHHFDSQVGGAQAACIEVIGYDPSTRTYPTHTYYNNGQSADWQLSERDETWVLTGRWESSRDGVAWEPFWDVKAIRA